MAGKKTAQKSKPATAAKHGAGAKQTTPKDTKKRKTVDKKDTKPAAIAPTIIPSRPWTDNEEVILADMWKSETHMFDRTTKDNKNDVMREQTLQSFCEKLDRTGKRYL